MDQEHQHLLNERLERGHPLRAYLEDAPPFVGREDLDGTLRDLVRVVAARIAAEDAIVSIAREGVEGVQTVNVNGLQL